MKIFTSIFLLFFTLNLNAQLTGKITNSKGEALSFASIYVQGTTNGTTSNLDGIYNFELSPGTYNVVYQYVGYKPEVVEIKIGSTTLNKDIVLAEESVNIQEIVVRADGEDPAYAIIRQAIAKRTYYKNLVDSYSCDVYIKGNQKLLDAPEKILGNEIGDLGGTLDSNRQGIIYLSESEAKLFYQKPDQKKEEMISSKVSGNDNGFSFNRASLMDFSFYENFTDLSRNIISPIANNALSYYRYKLLGTVFDENGHLINKIEVIPKRDEDPVYRGIIYIVEDLWNIQSVELMITGATVKQPILDTLVIKQVYVPVRDPDVWMLLSQSLSFKLGIFGFKIDGYFTGVYSNYDLDVQFDDKFFNNEIFKVNEGSNEKLLSYWDSIRPVPLTVEEEVDYVKKDSLEKIWESKEFMDSIDAKNNKFKIWSLLVGYQYNNSFEKTYFSVGSPLSTIGFNPVQGFYGNVDIVYRKFFDERSTRFIRINPKVQYGFSDHTWRADMSVAYNFSEVNFSKITVSGGLAITQFNDEKPISPFLNTQYALWDHKSFIKLYDKLFLKIKYQRELTNGIFFKGYIDYSQRKPLENTSEYSFLRKERLYEPNDPLYPNDLDIPFEVHEALVLGLSFRIRFEQKFISYPQRKYIMGSKFPDLWIHYRKGIAAFGSDVDYDLLKINVEDELTMGLFGRSEINVEAGLFINDNRVQFVDYQHFNGNQTFIFSPSKALSSFLMLPYYEFSTTKPFVQVHYQHHFEGFLLDKIPLVRKAGLKTVMGASFLYTEEGKDYYEVSFGLENLGFGIVKIFRVDVVASFRNGNYLTTGFRLGVDLGN